MSAPRKCMTCGKLSTNDLCTTCEQDRGTSAAMPAERDDERPGERRERVILGYLYVPIPDWVLRRFEACEMTRERKEIQVALYRRADREKLAGREPTPKLRLESLAGATQRHTDRRSLDALGRLLRAMRQDGELGFETSGVGDRIVYLFELFPDGPRSALVPTSERAAIPASGDTEDGSASGIPAGGAETRSGVATDATNGSVPGSASSIPGSEHPATPVAERGFAVGGGAVDSDFFRALRTRPSFD